MLDSCETRFGTAGSARAESLLITSGRALRPEDYKRLLYLRQLFKRLCGYIHRSGAWDGVHGHHHQQFDCATWHPYMALYLRHATRRAVVDGAGAVQPGPMATGPSAEAVQLLAVRRRPADVRWATVMEAVLGIAALLRRFRFEVGGQHRPGDRSMDDTSAPTWCGPKCTETLMQRNCLFSISAGRGQRRPKRQKPLCAEMPKRTKGRETSMFSRSGVPA
jgi:hypothetical protein